MPQLTIEQALQLARQHHQAGQLPQAEALYRQILRQNPNHPHALHLLAVLAGQTGRNDLAVDLLRRTIALTPDSPEAYANLGAALKNQGHFDAALAACRQALALKPGLAPAHCTLGDALHAQGQLEAAVAAYHQAIALDPCFPQALHNLALSLHAQGRVDEAIAAFRQALALKPDYADAHHNLANALHAQGQLDAAVAAYHQAIALKPTSPEAYGHLGNALCALQQLGPAIAAYHRAIALGPAHPDVFCNLGNALQTAGQLDDAIAAYRRAIALKPHFPEAYGNLGNALHAQGQLDAAIAACRQAVAFAPDNAAIHSNLIYTLHFHPACDAPALAAEHRRWNLRHAAPLRASLPPCANDPSPGRRLRIGYVSPDFREHPVGRFLLPLLARHDQDHFEVFAYAQVPAPDALTQRLCAYTHGWRSTVGLSDAQAADLIRQDRIDILVDLAMHTAGNRLLVFARKPAPVQATYLAYCSTTGLDTVDFRLSDPYLDPPDADESVYSEHTFRLPETYWCYQPNGATLEVNPLPALTQGHITFGCLNNFSKVSEPALAAWAQLLRALPNSQLLLHAPEGAHRQRVLQRLQVTDTESQRVRFAKRLPLDQYLSLYRQIDIALDPFPYSGGTTSCDALWMGVPVVSLVGRTPVGRGGLSILSNVGLPELAAHSEEEYVRIAAELARDLPRLENLRSTLRQRMVPSPLMDAPRFARHLEAAYRQMWRQWCARR